MSEKRFKLIKPLGTRLGLTDISIKDTQKDYYYTTKEMVVDLLNRLSEENEQLAEENEQLRQQSDIVRSKNIRLQEKLDLKEVVHYYE